MIVQVTIIIDGEMHFNFRSLCRLVQQGALIRNFRWEIEVYENKEMMKAKKRSLIDVDVDQQLTFSWDFDTFPLFSISRAVKAYQMDLSNSERKSMAAET